MPTAAHLVHLLRSGPVRVRTRCATTCHHLRHDERGEGVISAAIVVLIMAFLGVLMWGAFRVLFESAAETTRTQVDSIGG